MDTVRHLDDRILPAVNGVARHTGWPHGAVVGHATYGVALFAVPLLAGLPRRAGVRPIVGADPAAPGATAA